MIFLMRWDFRIPSTAEHFPAAEKVSPFFASPQVKSLDISCLERFCLELLLYTCVYVKEAD